MEVFMILLIFLIPIAVVFFLYSLITLRKKLLIAFVAGMLLEGIYHLAISSGG
jgi:hypothetical protein